MPYRLHVDPVRKRGLVELTGYVDAPALDEAADALVAAPGWGRDFGSLWDLRPATTVDVTPEGLKALVDRKEKRDEALALSGRIAVVVAREAVLGVAQFAVRRARASRREVRVFATVEEAEAWLGRPPAAAP